MRPTRILVGLGMIAAITAGCGDQNDAQAAAGTERYCELIQILNKPPTGIDPATATPEQMTATVKGHFATNADNITELQRVAPAEVAPDVSVFARVARHIAVTGDLNEFHTPDSLPAITRYEAFNKNECGINPPGPPGQ